jgi:hypothetical protein
MSNFLLYPIQRQGIFYIVRLSGTTHTRRFFSGVCVPSYNQNTHTNPFLRSRDSICIFATAILLIDKNHLPGVDSVVRAIPACPAEISWSKFLDLTTGSKKLWTQRLNINIDVESRDQTVVLESVVEVNDFSELWPSEADTASQVPLILLLSGRVRKSKNHFYFRCC